jgi:hypothetical protein
MDISKIRSLFPQMPPIADVAVEEGYIPAGWYSDHPALEEMVKTLRPHIILDVGTYLGGSAARFAKYAQKIHGDDFVVVAIDTWLGSTEHYTNIMAPPDERVYGGMFNKFRRNMTRAGVANWVLPLPQTSANAARILKYHGIEADLIYLDASHEYDDVMQDLRSFWPLVRKGGAILGDDFETPWEGVIRAATDFTALMGIDLEVSRHDASGLHEGQKRSGQAKFIIRKAE